MKRIVTLILAVLLCISSGLTVFAQDSVVPKEEVVYVNLNADGSVKGIYTVNSFEMKEAGTITDYGDYTSAINLTTSDSIVYTDGKVQIPAEKGMFYYQGNLKSTEIPWNIKIQYFLENQEITAKEIAGKTGAIKIVLSITENKEGISDFFDSYALQVSLAFDMEKTRNIVATDATIANIGSKKQLNYTILPGEEKEIVVSADVEQFEMDGITIGGVRMGISFNTDKINLSGLTDELKPLQDGIAQLDDGTKEVQTGADQLYTGSKELWDGAKELYTGGTSIRNGAKDLLNGGSKIKSGAQGLFTGGVALQKGMASLAANMPTLQTSGNTLADSGKQLVDGMKKLTDGARELQTGTAGLRDGLQALQENAGKLKQGVIAINTGLNTLAAQNSALLNGAKSIVDATFDNVNAQLKAAFEKYKMEAPVLTLENYTKTIEEFLSFASKEMAGQLTQLKTQLDGISAFYTGLEGYTGGVSSLADGTKPLSSGMTTFADGIDKVYQGSVSLADGTAKAVTGMSDLQKGIVQYADGVKQYAAGIRTLANGITSYKKGIDTYVNGVGTFSTGVGDFHSGIEKFDTGMGSYVVGLEKFFTGATDFSNGMNTFRNGIGDLKKGTSELRTQTATMDTAMEDKIGETIDTMMDSYSGTGEIKSFLSDKNTTVKGVQFVLQGEAIRIPQEAPVDAAPAQKTTFWDKILQLFGIGK